MTTEISKENISVGTRKSRITYDKLFWLFIIGSWLGVLMEGVFCAFKYGGWETHVVSMWGHFCIIYGFGIAGFYVGSVLMEGKNILLRFLVFTLIGTGVEYICGLLLDKGLNMIAWSYKGSFLNVNGYICLKAALLWGLLGTLFGALVPHIDKIFEKMQGTGWKVACSVLSVFMAVNLIFTAVCIVRWSRRHEGIAPASNIIQQIDQKYNDEMMAERFCEWRFIS